MKNLLERAKFVTEGEKGASNVEIVVWISVVLVIATILFLFRDAIKGFLNRATAKVNGLNVA